jgi:hypothetical protein
MIIHFAGKIAIYRFRYGLEIYNFSDYNNNGKGAKFNTSEILFDRIYFPKKFIYRKMQVKQMLYNIIQKVVQIVFDKKTYCTFLQLISLCQPKVGPI